MPFYLLVVLMLAAMLAAWLACWRIPRSAWQLRNILLASISLAIATEAAALVGMFYFMANSIVYNCCTPLEFFLLLWLIHRFRPHWGMALGVAAVIGCIAMVVDGFFQNPMDFVLVEGVLVISALLSIILLAALWSVATRSDIPLYRVPEFWLFMGMLLYFGGMVPYIGMIRFLFQRNPVLAEQVAVLMPLLCIGRYALTGAACIMQYKRSLGLQDE